jgi:hypothetical protein
MHPPQEARCKTEPPLWSMGLVVTLMVIVPFVLYSMAPAGPIREGDTIFTDGTVNVPMAHPLLYKSTGFDGTCLLDPNDPLMVLRQPKDRIEGVIFAKVQGKTAIEWPFAHHKQKSCLPVVTSYKKLMSGPKQENARWGGDRKKREPIMA